MSALIPAGLEKLPNLPAYDGLTDPDDHINNFNARRKDEYWIVCRDEELNVEVGGGRGYIAVV
jgi:hypothetical protein